MTDRSSLAEAIANWDRAAYAAGPGAEAERLRQEVLSTFPLEAWPTLDLQRYALGTGEQHTFSWWLEFGSAPLGSVAGGYAMKHLVFRKADGSWYFPEGFADEQQAWEAIRSQMVEAFRLAAADDFDAIGALPQLQTGSMTVAKAIYVYNPERMLPIFARGHRDYWMALLGSNEDGGAYAWEGSHRLLQVVRQQHPELGDWSPHEIMRFLYGWAHPNEAPTIVKIAPGYNAELWSDCLANGYVRVGWEAVGDLRGFTREEFGAAFAEQYGALYKGNSAKITEKANEVWMLTELDEGDIVLANRGTARIVGMGRVKDPGYHFRPELGEFAHTVAVDWFDPVEREIDPIKRWAFKTVATVNQAEYQRILGGKVMPKQPGTSDDSKAIPVPGPDPLLGSIERAVIRKGQAILFGPPGTGKTWNARRFSVWWLARRRGAGADKLLVDQEEFQRAEQWFSRISSGKRVWWMVANRAQWSWDQLFRDGSVDFRYGRLQRNYPLVQEGDLVVGYQSNPEKRVVALARISKGLHETADGPKLLLAPVAQVENGPTYDELTADATLKASEPMRFRNQGTLFGLTPAEADYLLAWLADRDPSVAPLVDEPTDGVPQLTRVTFHPSYSYEDFVEGYKPQGSGTGQLDLRLTDGIFKRLCRQAAADPTRDYLLLIDEINRGNIPKIFGELITLLERDKRGMTLTLPQSGESFSVPPNVYVLGTMNTADRSIRLLDAALRRRFAFIELMPDTRPLEGGRVGDLDLAMFLGELNRRIARVEGREKQVGQSFLLEDGEPVADSGVFALQFRHEILPLLQEYAYEDYRELAEYIGTDLVDVAEQRVRADVLDDSDRLVQALAKHLTPKPGAVETLTTELE